jgi:chorismate mutase
MTTATLTARIEKLTDDEIRDVMCGLMNDFRPEADTVFDACMATAQARMESAKFIALCLALEEAV